MIVNEMFRSLQGEGPCVGYPSTFIRFTKCVLQCHFCDSKHTWKGEDTDLNTDTDENYNKLIDYILDGPRHVVFTGGEPLMNYKDVRFKPMLSCLIDKGFEITFETTMMASSEDIYNYKIKNNYNRLYEIMGESTNLCRFMISPKMDTRCYKGELTEDDIISYYAMPKYVANKLLKTGNFFYKIVYDTLYKERILKLMERLPEDWAREYVYFMPLTPQPFISGSDKIYQDSCKRTAEFCIEHGYKYSPRIHIDIWGAKRGV